MAVLHVLRHAKSSWDEPGLADADRPLAPRGRRAARRIGQRLREAGIRPGLVLCSPAVRARETVELLGDALAGVDVAVEEALYGADADELEERLRRLPDTVAEALLVGHNPALQSLVLGLARPGELRDRAAQKLPTAALATLALDGAWAELDEGGATLTALVLPRELS
jgi:phosphohistidine phosphatase